jgi:cell fate (sporulation/competence/biofilm development) regulator YlbF (YheA/YmcA/DUF963 family)
VVWSTRSPVDPAAARQRDVSRTHETDPTMGDATVTACIELARRLGKAIVDSPEAGAYRAARDELGADAEASKTLTDYQQQAEKIAQLEEANKPVEVDDKHKLQELNGKLIASDLFKKFTAAQMEYVDLMRKVNQALRSELAVIEQ